MSKRSSFVQIRVTPDEKRQLRRLADASGQDLSSYLLSRALPSTRSRFRELVDRLGDDALRRLVLAELNDFLTALAPLEFAGSVADADPSPLNPFVANYLAAMVEQTAYLKGVDPPHWTRDVTPLDLPYFASPLRSHRLHLLRTSPVPFKRRNLFVDASVGARV